VAPSGSRRSRGPAYQEVLTGPIGIPAQRQIRKRLAVARVSIAATAKPAVDFVIARLLPLGWYEVIRRDSVARTVAGRRNEACQLVAGVSMLGSPSGAVWHRACAAIGTGLPGWTTGNASHSSAGLSSASGRPTANYKGSGAARLASAFTPSGVGRIPFGHLRHGICNTGPSLLEMTRPASVMRVSVGCRLERGAGSTQA